MIHHSAFIHPKAVVDYNCHIGAGTKVWACAVITRGTRLGEDCVVAANANLDGSTFGDRCKIGAGVVIGPGFKIGDEVFIGPNVTFCNDMWPEVNAEGFDIENLLSRKHFVIEVEHGASIGANAVILPGVFIRAFARVAASAVVDKSVPENTMFHRNGYIGQIPMDSRKRRMKWTSPLEGE